MLYTQTVKQAGVRLSAVLFALALGACTQLQNNGPSNSARTPNAPTTSDSLSAQRPLAPAAAPDERLIQRLGALPPQPLKAESCALFLWASLPEQTLVYYGSSLEAGGIMSLDGQVTRLALTKSDGQTFGGIPSRQSLQAGQTSITLAINPVREAGFTDGAVIRRASLRISDETGWEVVMPVAGLIGCSA